MVAGLPRTLGVLSTAVVAFKLFSTSSVMACAVQPDPKLAASVYEFSASNIKGEEVKLDQYRGNVLVIVNVASKCGYTAQHYKELNELHDELADKGLRILAFPCNQFGNQEPGDSEQIQCFVRDNKVKFDLFDKVDVNGNGAHPLFTYLKMKQGGLLVDAIKWNFTKFIVDKNGQPVERHAPNTSPQQMKENLMKYL